jgi:hypothetical protein
LAITAADWPVTSIILGYAAMAAAEGVGQALDIGKIDR